MSDMSEEEIAKEIDRMVKMVTDPCPCDYCTGKIKPLLDYYGPRSS